MIWRAGLVWLICTGTAGAVDLSLPPAARQTVERNTGLDSYAAPVGVFADDAVETVTVEGNVDRAVWRLDASGLTPLQVVRPLRSQLEAAGYTVVLDCRAPACGGFDFRFATEVLPGPNMYVNIRNYQFVTAVLGQVDAPEHVVTVLASTAATSAYVQIIQARSLSDTAAEPTGAADAQVAEIRQPDALAATLVNTGRVVLSSLEFETGTSGLGPAKTAALDSLAAFLAGDPALRVALVGHTDTVGGLEDNVALSRSRAASVRQRLIDAYGVSPDQLEAQGMGYLAPIASNLTAQGRETNRRVEAVLLPEPGQ